MLIIFGSRVVYRTVGRGTLHCQRCGGDRDYRHRAGRRWLTLFFVPLIPLMRTGEHVRCTDCGTCYRLGVLALPTVAQMQAALPAGTVAAVSAMLLAGGTVSAAASGGPSGLADGVASGPARRRAVDMIAGTGIAGYDERELDADLMAAAGPGFDLAGPLSDLAAQLAAPAAEWFLADIVRVGLADGPLTSGEREAAAGVAAALGMTPAHARGVISMTEESATAG